LEVALKWEDTRGEAVFSEIKKPASAVVDEVAGSEGFVIMEI
jgi:hypothetical protein